MTAVESRAIRVVRLAQGMAQRDGLHVPALWMAAEGTIVHGVSLTGLRDSYMAKAECVVSGGACMPPPLDRIILARLAGTPEA